MNARNSLLFSLLDEDIGERVTALAQDDTWLTSIERSGRKANATDIGILALDAEEMQPFIDLASVPSDAMLDIDDANVPEIAQDIHASALSYYVMMPAMLRMVSTGGIIATLVFTDSIEEAEADNLAEQRTLTNRCPSLIKELDDLASSSEVHQIGNVVEDNETDLRELRDLDVEDFVGTGYSVLFFADETESHSSMAPGSISEMVAQGDIPFAQPPVTQSSMPVSGDRPYVGALLGAPDAPVTMVVYSDFQCPYCRLFANETLPQIINDFVLPGEVKLEFREFPIIGGTNQTDAGNESVLAATAVLCAAEQDSYLPYFDKLFANQAGENLGAYSDTRLSQFADKLGLDPDAFDTCLESGRYESAVQQSKKEGVALGITAVPMFLINGNVIQMTDRGYDLLKKQIEAAVEANAASSLTSISSNPDLIAEQKTVVAEHPNEVDEIVLLANLLGNTGQIQQAIPWYEQALALAPDDPGIRLDFARSLAGANLQTDAEAQFLRLLEDDPPNGPLLPGGAVHSLDPTAAGESD